MWSNNYTWNKFIIWARCHLAEPKKAFKRFVTPNTSGQSDNSLLVTENKKVQLCQILKHVKDLIRN